MFRATAIAATIMMFFASVPSSAAQESPEVGGAPMFRDKELIEDALRSGEYTTLVAAVKAAGLLETISGPGPFTILAPTNEAFDALAPGEVDALFAPENKEQLSRILQCHVLPMLATKDDIVTRIHDGDGKYVVQTVGGCTIIFSEGAGHVTATGETGTLANLTVLDVLHSNGLIHVVDQVLLPAK